MADIGARVLVCVWWVVGGGSMVHFGSAGSLEAVGLQAFLGALFERFLLYKGISRAAAELS